MKRSIFAVAVVVTALAILFTWFYVVHEDLPRSIRAPTSLLLAPVAVADGLAHYLGLEKGVYGSLTKVFAVNWLAWALFCWFVLVVRERFRSRGNGMGGSHASGSSSGA